MLKSEICLPISEIVIQMKNRRLGKYDEVMSFIAYDSETYEGSCKLLCDSKGNYLLDGSFYDYLEFLINYDDDNSHRVFWNMDFDLSSIFKLYKQDNEKIERLIQGYIENFKGYELLYLRPKFFVIKKGKNRKVFTDLYFMYRLSLNYASELYLNDKKIDDIDGNKLNTNLNYWNERLDDIIKYCVKDCVLTQKLGIFLLENVKKAKLPIPRYLTSHASFSKEFFMRESKIASIRWIPENILDIATQCYYGGRFEILFRGYIERLYSYDINSAYPDTITKLPSFKYGKWIKVKKGNRKEVIGFYKVRFLIPETRISPFIIKFRSICMFPSGVFETWITWYEYDLIKDYILEFFYGYEYVPNEKEYFPYREAILKLYDRKSFFKYGTNLWKRNLIYNFLKPFGFGKKWSENIDDVLSWIFKIFMNAVYGCFIERNKDVESGIVFAGKLFNSVNASIITARTRWKLLKDVKKKNWKYLGGFHTDSIFSLKKLKELKLNKKIGNWSKEKEGKAILLMSGVYQIGKDVRNRGFSTKKDTSLKDNDKGSIIDWFDLLLKNGHNDKIMFKKMKVMKSAESIKRFGNLEKVNTFSEFKKELNINSDKKRQWKRDFRDCFDVLTGFMDSKAPKMKFIRDDDLY